MTDVCMDRCVECGSTALKVVKRDVVFEKPNPGAIKIHAQPCIECQNCGEIYFDETQATGVARAIDVQLGKA